MWVFLPQYLWNPVYVYTHSPCYTGPSPHLSFPSHQKSEHFCSRQSLQELLFTAGEGKGKLGTKKKKQETKRTKGSSGRGSCCHRLAEELRAPAGCCRLFVLVAVNPVTHCLFSPVSLVQLWNTACSTSKCTSLAKASVMEMKLFAQSRTNTEGRNSS